MIDFRPLLLTSRRGFQVLAKFSKLQIGVLKGAAHPIAETNAPDRISVVPFAETPHWQDGLHASPHYNASHERFRKHCRELIESRLRGPAEAGEDSGEVPSLELYQWMGREGLLAARIGTLCMADLPSGIRLPGGVSPEEFDYFHELVCHEEIARLLCPGFVDGLGAGFWIALPPVIRFAQPSLKAAIVPDVLRGDKRICLAITEPQTGSDVAGITTTAQLSSDGSHYCVTGTKKWITNGTFADYFTTVVRTGGPGMKGLSMLLIERDDTVDTKVIKSAYSHSAGTALVNFSNTRVPVDNLFGKPGEGFKLMVQNFNHERWIILVQVQQSMRTIVDQCFKWLSQRKAFNKPLTEQPVLRFKLARMVAATESVHAWLEQATHQMNSMTFEEQNLKLGGHLALLKYETTRAANLVSDEAVQLFGGRGVSRGGMGKYVERYMRSFKIFAIYGGSEEIMADLGVRQALRTMSPHVRL